MPSPLLPESVRLYAELLSNIRQVSVAATLPTLSSSSTRVDVVEDGQVIRVQHQGQTETLSLPVQVALSSELPTPSKPSLSMTWRLPVSPSELKSSRRSTQDEVLPWNAVDLKVGSKVSCRKCDTTLVSPAKIQAWKDLPSENWAEMMEFWHCHKPHGENNHHEHDDEILAAKGYGANNLITAQTSAGLVDIASFMFAESDCSNIVFSSSTNEAGYANSTQAADNAAVAKFLNVYCNSCAVDVGLFNVQASAVILFKWQVNCETADYIEPPSSAECLAATLAASIARSGSSKSVVVPTVSAYQAEENFHKYTALNLWVLNPSLTYTSSLTGKSRSAMKVLYKDIDEEEADKMIESMTLNIQEITLPASAIREAKQALGSSNDLLPDQEKVFQGWTVGLLDRWTQ